MSQLEVDASNSCIPPNSPLVGIYPPLPTSLDRGEPCVTDGVCGRLNSDRPVLLYPSGKLVIVLELSRPGDGNSKPVRAFAYRGHRAQVSCAKFSPSGCYVASADIRGNLRVWSYDNPEHLCKLDLRRALPGVIRDLSWDGDSKRIALVGDCGTAGEGCKVIQWDTGVTASREDLGQHARNRVMSCDMRKERPMRFVSAGREDHSLILNKGPPFTKLGDVKDAHVRGSVNCVRYSFGNDLVASVGGDKRVCFYDGKTLELRRVMEDVHQGSIYGCAWSWDDQYLLTSGADAKCNLIDVEKGELVHTWDLLRIHTIINPINGMELTHMEPKKNIKPFGSMQIACAFVHGNQPISVGYNGQIARLPMPPELTTGDAVQLDLPSFISGHQCPIAAMVIQTSSLTLFTGDTDGLVCQWDVVTGQCKRVSRKSSDENEEAEHATMMDKVHSGNITAMVISAEGVLLSIGWDDVLRITSRDDNGNMVATNKIKIDAQPNGLARGTDLVVLLTVGGVAFFKAGKLISDILPLPYGALSACISKDDDTLCIGGDDRKIHVYAVPSDTPITTPLLEKHTISAHLRPVHSLQLSPDGTRLASADSRDVCVWDVTDNFSQIIGINRWCFHSQKITSLAWSPSGAILASGGLDDHIFIWSLTKKMKRVHYPFSHRGGITCLGFLQEGLLLSTGNDGCVCHWDISDDVRKKFG